MTDAERAALVRRLLQYAQFCAWGERDLLREAADALSQISAPKPAPLSPERIREIAQQVWRDPWKISDESTVEIIVRAITQALSESAPSGWQPIESVPDNHLPILIHGEYGMLVAFRDITWEWWPCPARERLGYVPTHWMPLPACPLSAAEAAKVGE